MALRARAVALGLCLAVGAAAILAGCGSGGGGRTVAAARYATALCRAIGPFERDLASGAGALQAATMRSPRSGRHVLVSFLAKVGSDTGSAASRLRAVGVPEIRDGARVARDFAALFARLHSALEAALRNARTLPTTTASAFRAAATRLGERVRLTMGDVAAGDVRTLRNPELAAAARRSPACHAL
jgi:hypothetical protein